MESQGLAKVSLEEAVKLGAVDGSFFGSFFFPRAFKQSPPPCHKDMDRLLDDPDSPFVSFMIARGFAKTTKTRVYIARRIAYGISRTVMIVGKSQDAAIKSLEWLKKSVEHNQRYSNAFGLAPGGRWSGADIEIIHHQFQDENGGPLRIRVLAFGMTGSVRGVNIDDMRPDLIVVDDPCDEENTATPEQRRKTADLFFGAIAKSLAPKSECPHSKMVLLQTVLNNSDLVSLCEKDSKWKSLRVSCFTPEGVSSWPDRFPTEELKEEKQGYVDRGMLSLWMREMECKCVSDDLVAFKESALKYWDEVVDGVGGHVPEGGLTFLAIDPTPPPKDPTQANKASRKLDTAVIAVMRVVYGKLYILDFYGAKSPDPGEFIGQIFQLCRLYRTKQVVVETILFARVLRWAIDQESVRRREYLNIHPIEDRRAKPLRIQQEIAAQTSQGALLCSSQHTDFIQQYLEYPVVDHDDYLDAVAIGCMYVTPWVLENSFIEGEFEEVIEAEIKALGDWRAKI